jgi:hypothetical protein
MYILRTSALAVTIVALSLSGPTLKASDKDDKVPARITVSFGTGNNNSNPGNTPNHHILPQEFTVRITSAKRVDGTVLSVPATVNFVIAGFHHPWVFVPGVTVQEVKDHIPASNPLLINYEVVTNGVSNVFAKGVFPGTPPAFTDLIPANPVFSAAQNRNESFAFGTPGRYLVICNVRPHFLDGMYAWINVVPENAKDKDGKDDGGQQGHDHAR